MNIYIVNAHLLRFSVGQLRAVMKLRDSREAGGIIDGVAWVRDNDDDIIILATEYRHDGLFKLLPRRHDFYHMDVFCRAADYLMTIRTEWQEGPIVKLGWGVNAGRCGDGWIMNTDSDYVNQKALAVNQGKMNISYKEGDKDDCA